MSLAVAEKQNVQRTGTVEKQSFTIEASPMAFSILSDGLYSKKITAILRELGTNAVDSHIDANTTDIPFEVHLPNLNEPWFKIRDFGTGLSHDSVMSLYSTYFASNKTNNPHVTGLLGLGSKSPLAYSRSFTVTSYVDGVKNNYVIMLDEDKIPQVNYLPDQSGPTDEPNGVEIVIAARRADFDEFCRESVAVYRHFKFRPKVIGNPTYKIDEQEVLVQGNGWRIIKSGDYGSKPIAVMGNIAYPIVATSIHDITAPQQKLLSCNIQIDFEIGELEFTPSRESLSYKRRTSEKIRNRLDVIINEINTELSNKFATAGSLWEARVMAYKLFWSSDSSMSHFRSIATLGNILYDGKPIQDKDIDFKDIKGVVAYDIYKKSRYRSRYSRNPTSNAIVSIKREECNTFSSFDRVVWCEADMPRGNFSRCNALLNADKAKHVYLVAFDSNEARKAFCEVMGLKGDEFVKTSELPKPEIRRGATASRVSSDAYIHTGSDGESRLYRYWNTTTINLDDGGVYVEMRNHKAYVNDVEIDPRVIGELITNLKCVGHDVKVIGVRPAIAKDFKELDDWVNIFDYVKTIINNQVIKSSLGKKIANANEYDKIIYDRIWGDFRKGLTLKKSNSDFYTFIDILNVLAKDSGKSINRDAWKKLAAITHVDIDGVADHKANEQEAVVMSKYPMLKVLVEFMASYEDLDEKCRATIIDYIDMVDAAT